MRGDGCEGCGDGARIAEQDGASGARGGVNFCVLQKAGVAQFLVRDLRGEFFKASAIHLAGTFR